MKYKKNKLIFIITLITLFTIYFNNTIATKGALQGIYIWYSSLVPALLPTLILLNVILSISSSKCNVVIFFLIILAGIPTNAKILSDMYTTKRISLFKYKFLLILSSNPSLAFLTTYIFLMITKKYSITPKLIFYPFLIVILSSLITAMIFYLFNNQSNYIGLETISNESTTFSLDLFDKIINNSVNTLVRILGYVVVFSTLSEMLTLVGNNFFILFVRIFLEMSCGILLVLENYHTPLLFYPVICSLCSFGGICAIFQMFSIIPKEQGISLIFVLKYKMLNALLAFSICYIANKIIF